MFNEMAPNSGDLAYLTACNAATYGAMQAVNNRSVYMMQAWLFHEDFWTPARVQAYLAGSSLLHLCCCIRPSSLQQMRHRRLMLRAHTRQPAHIFIHSLIAPLPCPNPHSCLLPLLQACPSATC